MDAHSAIDRSKAWSDGPYGVGVELAPDILTPEQFAGPSATERLDSPEIRLMIAVLEEAVATYQRLAVAGDDDARLLRDVEGWLWADDPTWLYSFANICDVLGFVPARLRDGLAQWRAERASDGPVRHRYPFRRVAGRRNAVVAGRGPRRSSRDDGHAEGSELSSVPSRRGGRECESLQAWCS